MFKTLKKIWIEKWIFRSLLHTAYFNFHYLPFRQAIKFPIFLYKPKLLKCNGKVRIEAEHVTPGMVRMGEHMVSLYPNNGITFENHGGEVVFKGKCRIGNNSVITIGNKGYVEFGHKFQATTTLRVVGYNKIIFKDNVLCGWECTFMDTDGHKLTLKNMSTNDMKIYTKGYGEICIGENNWFGTHCCVLKNTITSNYMIFGACSVIHGNLQNKYPPYSILGMDSKLELKKENIYINIDDDKIIYE